MRVFVSCLSGYGVEQHLCLYPTHSPNIHSCIYTLIYLHLQLLRPTSFGDVYYNESLLCIFFIVFLVFVQMFSWSNFIADPSPIYLGDELFAPDIEDFLPEAWITQCNMYRNSVN